MQITSPGYRRLFACIYLKMVGGPVTVILEGKGCGIDYSAFSPKRKCDCGENLDFYTLGKVQRETVGQVGNEISLFLKLQNITKKDT
jgi:hypothetical protein